MNELARLALELQEFCVGQDWKFCFIGGLALHIGVNPATPSMSI
jgi:hypothetical protein